MKTNYLITILFGLLTFPNVFAQQSSSSEPITRAQLTAMVVDNPDSVLLILDRIGPEGTVELPPYRISMMKGIAYNEKGMFSYVDKYAREALNSKDIKNDPDDESTSLILLSCAQTFFGNTQDSLESLLRALEIARETDDLSGELMVLSRMAENYFDLGNREEGYSVIEQIVQIGSYSQDVRVLANVSAAYGIKVIQLYTDNRFDEALAAGRKRLEIIDRIDEIGGAPKGFTDQQRAYAYARIASSAQKVGKTDVATKAYEDFLATDYGSSDGKHYIVDYLLESKKFATVLEYTRPLYDLLEAIDTVNMDFHSLLFSNAEAYYGLGNYKAGYELLQRADVIKDSLHTREQTMQAQELAAVFSLNEKTLELEKERGESQRRLILLWMISGVCLLAVVILVILLRQYNIIKRHQRLAAQRIDELIMERETELQLAEGGIDPDKKLFIDMENKIIGEELFKNSSFNRDDIAKAVGLSRNKVVQLIQQYVGLTPNDYINKLRVEHSAKLIKEHPEWSIDGIAEICGYARRATYYSNFNKCYDITPAQYRKQVLSTSPA